MSLVLCRHGVCEMGGIEDAGVGEGVDLVTAS